MRRLTASLFAGLLFVSVAGPAAAASPAFDLTTLVQAETDLARLVNLERTAQGLVELRLDPETMAIARQRAETMAATDRLSHENPDGSNVFDAIVAAGIPWQGAGEVIVWNNYAAAPDSTAQAVSAWMGSASHRSIVLSGDYNYVGFGAAVSPVSGNRYYAGVLLKRPDRTPPWAKAGRTSVRVVDRTHTRVTVRWTGGDPQLQVLTAGIRDYEVQRRPAGGAWRSLGVRSGTSLSETLTRARTYDYRIRARDRAGNRSPWELVTVRI
jgi:uncharacterized protein YkwD